MSSAENKSNIVIKSQKTRVLDSPRLHDIIAHVICSSPWDSLGKNTGVVCRFLLQGNLPDPGIKPRFSTLQADSLPFEPPAKPLTQQGNLRGNLQNWAICNSLSFLLIWQMWKPMEKSPISVTQLGGDDKGVWLVWTVHFHQLLLFQDLLKSSRNKYRDSEMQSGSSLAFPIFTQWSCVLISPCFWVITSQTKLISWMSSKRQTLAGAFSQVINTQWSCYLYFSHTVIP